MGNSVAEKQVKQEHTQPARSAGRTALMLGALCAVGLVLRSIGLGFGLPELYHADEPIVVNHAMAYGTWDFNPHFFQIPPLTSYLLFASYALYFLGGWVFGKFSGSDAFADLFFTDPTSFYLIGRFTIGVLPGVLTIAFVFLLGKRVFSRQAGLWAAAFLSVCFLAVRDAHYIYTDTLLGLLLTLCSLTLLGVQKRGVMKDYMRAGLLMGLCVSVKYNAALIGVAYVVAHVLRAVSLRSKIFCAAFWGGLGAAGIAFLVTNPYALLDYSFFWESVTRQGQSQGFMGWLHHLTYSLNGAMGGYALTVALAGVLIACLQKNKRAWILLGFVIPFYLGITFMGQPHDRYVLPLLPFLSIFLGGCIVWALERLRERKGLAAMRWAGVVAFLLLIFPMAVKSAYSDWLFLQTDSRTAAKRWIEQNIPAGSKIALDHTFYNPVLRPTLEQLRQKRLSALDKETQVGPKQAKLDRLMRLVKPGDKRYELYFLSDVAGGDRGYLFSEPTIPFDFERLQKEGIKVVVSHRVFAKKPHFDFWAKVEQHAPDFHRFSPYREDWRDFSMEPQVRTGGPFWWPEMLARKSNGEHVMVYVLE